MHASQLGLSTVKISASLSAPFGQKALGKNRFFTKNPILHLGFLDSSHLNFYRAFLVWRRKLWSTKWRKKKLGTSRNGFGIRSSCRASSKLFQLVLELNSHERIAIEILYFNQEEILLNTGPGKNFNFPTGSDHSKDGSQNPEMGESESWLGLESTRVTFF